MLKYRIYSLKTMTGTDKIAFNEKNLGVIGCLYVQVHPDQKCLQNYGLWQPERAQRAVVVSCLKRV